MYQDIALNCFRYLGFTSFKDVDNLDLREYNLLMKAVKLKEVDKEYYIHLQAFLNFSMKATKGSKRNPKPVYKNFKDFFDYEKHIKEALNEKSESDKQKDRLLEYKIKHEKEK